MIGKNEAIKELIPIKKLKDFLTWRQKEFVEKYQGVRYDTEQDTYSILEAESPDDGALIALINTSLLDWDSKASHPWIGSFTIHYDGSKNNGMPDKSTYALLDKIEQEIMNELKDRDGYLNIGRQTAGGERDIYFACKDFRKPSKVFFDVQKVYGQKLQIDYNIYKDKYWQTFERFQKTVD